MSYKLVVFQKNYADEFDVYGFTIMDAKEFNDFQLDVNTSEYPVEKYFGTNEYIEFNDVEEVFESLSITDISGEQEDFIESRFGESFGWFPEFEGAF